MVQQSKVIKRHTVTIFHPLQVSHFPTPHAQNLTLIRFAIYKSLTLKQSNFNHPNLNYLVILEENSLFTSFFYVLFYLDTFVHFLTF